MTELNIGDTAPDFTLPTDSDGSLSLDVFKGQKLVLYFYPKDDTPGCTKQACAFKESLEDFNDLNTAVIGISKCSPSKHDKFKAKYKLNFPLASDEDGDVCERYGVWVEKNMYGRKYMGIERTTFLIDEDGKIAKIWRKVKVKDHIDEVKAAIADLAKAA